MLDLVFVFVYIAVLLVSRKVVLIAAILPLLIAVMIPMGEYVVLPFTVIAFAYAMFALLVSHKSLSLSIALLGMAIYSLIFAIDSGVNSNVETWLYNNHEIIISLLHIAIVLSVSKRAVKAANHCFDSVSGFFVGDKRGVLHFFSSKKRDEA